MLVERREMHYYPLLFERGNLITDGFLGVRGCFTDRPSEFLQRFLDVVGDRFDVVVDGFELVVGGSHVVLRCIRSDDGITLWMVRYHYAPSLKTANFHVKLIGACSDH